MALVAVKNHRHGVTNPKAQMRYEITVEQVLNAPMVVEPFGLYDCTPQSDGAAAVLLVSEDVVDRYTDTPVWVRGVGLGLDRVMHAHKPKGHPPGATGVAQCVELFEQLRGRASNQVDGARWALAHNVGGPPAVSAVTILSTEKP
jgi:acetyl-CoA acetyltransferase